MYCFAIKSADAHKDHTPEYRKASISAFRIHRSMQAPLRHIAGQPLMLLGSPPDMVREWRLRKTRISTRKICSADLTETSLKTGISPCFSGLQVQGSAMSPVSVTFVRIGGTKKVCHNSISHLYQKIKCQNFPVIKAGLQSLFRHRPRYRKGLPYRT